MPKGKSWLEQEFDRMKREDPERFRACVKQLGRVVGAMEQERAHDPGAVVVSVDLAGSSTLAGILAKPE